MNIQKVKEALEAAKAELPDLSSAPIGKEPQAIRAARLVCEAIAELERPVDDNLDLESVVQCISEDAEVAYEASDFDGKPDYYVQLDETRAKEHIQQYAESYHAKKCAECTQKKSPYKLFGVD